MIDGSLIKYYRTKNGLTQADLARGICSITYLSKVENNKMEPSDEVLDSLCAKLGIKATLLTKSLGEDVRQLLETWNTYMDQGDQKKARELYLKIKADSNDQIYYYIRHIYNLFLFRYYIFSYQLEKADELYPNIINIKGSLSEKGQYYYCKYLGIYFNNKQKLSKALDLLLEAVKRGEALHVKDAHLFHLLAIITMKMDRKMRAILYAQKAIKLYQDELNYERITSVNLILAINYILIDETNLGRELLLKIIAKGSTRQDDNLQSHIYHNIGLSYYREKKYELAIQHFKTSLQTKRKESVNNLRTVYMLAYSYYHLNQLHVAKKYIEKVEAMSLQNQHENETYQMRAKILSYLIEGKKYEKGFMDFLKNTAIPYFEKNSEKRPLMECYEFLGEAHYHHNQYKPAADCFKEKMKVDKIF